MKMLSLLISLIVVLLFFKLNLSILSFAFAFFVPDSIIRDIIRSLKLATRLKKKNKAKPSVSKNKKKICRRKSGGG